MVVGRRPYGARDEAMVGGGIPCGPDAAWRDAIVATAAVAVVFVLAAIFGAPELGKPPDPTNVVADPRPDWYFLGYFAVLALIPPATESIVIVGLPLFAFVFLFLVPILWPDGERHWSRRPAAIAAGALPLLAPAPPPPAGVATPPGGPAPTGGPPPPAPPRAPRPPPPPAAPPARAGGASCPPLPRHQRFASGGGARRGPGGSVRSGRAAALAQPARARRGHKRGRGALARDAHRPGRRAPRRDPRRIRRRRAAVRLRELDRRSEPPRSAAPRGSSLFRGPRRRRGGKPLRVRRPAVARSSRAVRRFGVPLRARRRRHR